MRLRKTAKRWLYGSCPGFAGTFPYFGVRVHFPKGSALFHSTCEQGVFERASVQLLQGLARPGSWYFDVGANIGLMAVPILAKLPTVNILSCEPSPNILPFLRRTIRESGHSGRWHLVEKAAGRAPGRIDFHLGPVAESELDGIRHTRRAPLDRIVEVEMTSLDAEWQRLGKPDVSIVKIDVEGGELGVLEGSQALLQAARPHVILEWHQENLLAYDCPASALIEFAERMHYQIFALPRLTKVHGDTDLRVHMLQTENFLLLP